MKATLPLSLLLSALIAFSSATSLFAEKLSPLATSPQWSDLEAYQKTITRSGFLFLINQVYAPDQAFWQYTTLESDLVTVYSTPEKKNRLWTLHFARNKASTRKPPVSFYPEPTSPKAHAQQQNSLSPHLPLQGVKICLDPGHIGGQWAQLEERYLKIGNNSPILEAEMALITAQHVARQLKQLGATVYLTKTSMEPVTSKRPENLRKEAKRAIELWQDSPLENPTSNESQILITKMAEKLFYRSAEIYARAEKIEKWIPDLTIAIHYNAAPWGNPDRPRLVDHGRLVVFVHGVYSAEELSYDDQKFQMLRNLLDGVYPLELSAAETIAQQMSQTFSMPPELYPNWNAVQRVGSNPYVFARNLLANRLFRGPVVFVEGPYMNAKDAYQWMEAGDYKGLQTFYGKKVPSIMQTMANAIVQGVVDYMKGSQLKKNLNRLEQKKLRLYPPSSRSKISGFNR